MSLKSSRYVIKTIDAWFTEWDKEVSKRPTNFKYAKEDLKIRIDKVFDRVAKAR